LRVINRQKATNLQEPIGNVFLALMLGTFYNLWPVFMLILTNPTISIKFNQIVLVLEIQVH